MNNDKTTMTRTQAECLFALLDIATEGNWPDVAEAIQSRGWTPQQVCDAWRALANDAGMAKGTTPTIEDF